MNSRIMIAGTNSGCGKTTVTTALLSLLSESEKTKGKVSAFKCGPDYIDPMFHRKVLGVSSHNLDPFFSSPEQLNRQISKAEGISVIEGVMGYYDGIGIRGDCSSWSLASSTKTPVILVINGRGMYTSSAAIMKGFKDLRKDSMIRGVIFNNVNKMVYDGLSQIAVNSGLQPLGYLPRDPEITIGSRHLGLITAGEIRDLHRRLRRLKEIAAETLDIEGILALASAAEPLPLKPETNDLQGSSREIRTSSAEKPVIAVAKDQAFSFIYQETLEAFINSDAEVCYFSPVQDEHIPAKASALYLPGGYPELYAEELSTNKSMLKDIREKIFSGMPTIAECGGFLYLHETIDGVSMAGIFPSSSRKTERLQHFGYVTLTANEDNLLVKAGGKLRAHEFHYYDSTDYGRGFTAEKASTGRTYPCVFCSHSLYAGFPHLYLASEPEAVSRFVKAAAEYSN